MSLLINRKFVSFILAFIFIAQTAFPANYVFAQQATLNLPLPGEMVSLSQSYVPVLLKGMTLHADNPFKFDFIIDEGQTRFSEKELKDESQKLVKYFLASMTMPQNDLWVNLSPYESNRIIPDELAKTQLGRDLLSQDYILKQLSATLMFPDSQLGKKFWDRVHQRIAQQYGKVDISENTFNKVWILPDEAVVYENDNTVYIVKARLKVMLDVDYQAQQDIAQSKDLSNSNKNQNLQISNIVRDIVLPEIEKEVNEGKNFASVRQIYYALILAKWYKEAFKDSVLNKIYIDQKKVSGIDEVNSDVKEEIYQQYMKAYQKGVFNFIREDYDQLSQEVIPRKYFSGGFRSDNIEVQRDGSAAMVNQNPPVGRIGVASVLLAAAVTTVNPQLARAQTQPSEMSVSRDLVTPNNHSIPKNYDDLIAAFNTEQDPGQLARIITAIGRFRKQEGVVGILSSVIDPNSEFYRNHGSNEKYSDARKAAAGALRRYKRSQELQSVSALLIDEIRRGNPHAVWVVDVRKYRREAISAIVDAVLTNQVGIKQAFFEKNVRFNRNGKVLGKEKYFRAAKTEKERAVLRAVFQTIHPRFPNNLSQTRFLTVLDLQINTKGTGVDYLFARAANRSALLKLEEVLETPEELTNVLKFVAKVERPFRTNAARGLASMLEVARLNASLRILTKGKLLVQEGRITFSKQVSYNGQEKKFPDLVWEATDIAQLETLAQSGNGFYKPAAQKALPRARQGLNVNFNNNSAPKITTPNIKIHPSNNTAVEIPLLIQAENVNDVVVVIDGLPNAVYVKERNSILFLPTKDDFGKTFIYTIRISDANGEDSDQATLELTNSLPKFSRDSADVRAGKETKINIKELLVDSDQDAISSIEIINAPDFVSFDPLTGQLTTKPSLVQGNTSEFIKFKVTDSVGGEAELSFELKIGRNHLPDISFTRNTEEITVGTELKVPVFFIDEDSDPLQPSIYFSNLPDQATRDLSFDTDQNQWFLSIIVPADVAVGNYSVVLQVSDGVDNPFFKALTVKVILPSPAAIVEQKNGGIDMNTIDLKRQGKKINIKFDEEKFKSMINQPMPGLTPLMTNFQFIPNVLQYLGLQKELNEPIKISSRN